MSDDKHAATLIAHVESPPERVHPLVELAMRGGQVDPATLRELMVLQREWEADESRRAYTRALIALKTDLPRVLARDASVDYTTAKGRTHYRHTSLAAAADAVTEPLTMHGFAATWVPSTGERDMVTVTCRLQHCDGHSESATISAPRDTSGNKSPAQGVASTITLLSRYTLLSLLGIATADHVEPTGEASAVGAVDTQRNMRAVAAITRAGRTLQDAEAVACRPLAEWTDVELAALRSWLRQERETGHDDE